MNSNMWVTVISDVVAALGIVLTYLKAHNTAQAVKNQQSSKAVKNQPPQ